jgi:hypothetical protein
VDHRVASGTFLEVSYPKQWLLAQRSYSKDSSRIAPISSARSVERNLAVAVRLTLGSEQFSMWGQSDLYSMGGFPT